MSANVWLHKIITVLYDSLIIPKNTIFFFHQKLTIKVETLNGKGYHGKISTAGKKKLTKIIELWYTEWIINKQRKIKRIN